MFTLALGLMAAPKVLALVATLAGLGLGMAWLSNEPEIIRLAALALVDKATGLLNHVRNLSVQAANYAVTGAEPSGTRFTTTGAAGAVTFTLPAVAARFTGKYYEFFNTVAQNMSVAGTAGQVMTFNNIAATSVTASTANQLKGALITAFCDGAAWHVTGVTVGVTYTVA